MTWILASSLLLGAVLVTGFAWYERTHPTTRVLALVATLAALAALGRVAFAPLPNVKPTTDIVLIAGLVLGGAPGFMVGAVAALASNLFFGQGPWTPWQMAAWGAVGVLGALLRARLAGRPLGRVPLALACGARRARLRRGHEPAHVDHLLGRPHARQARRLLRDLAAVRPRARVRQRRLRARLRAGADPRAAALPHRGWRSRGCPRPAAAGVARRGAARGLVAGGAAAPRRRAAQSADAAAAKASLRYLAGAQNDDGGWGGAPGQSSTQLHTGWTALGLAAAGRNPRDVGGTTAIDFTRARARELDDLGELSRTILVFRAAGLSPRDVGGRDLVAELLRKRKANGSFAGRVNTTAFAAMALKASGGSPRALRGAGPLDRRPGQRRRRLQLRRPRRPVGDRRHRRGDPGPRGRRPQAARGRSRAPRASSSAARTPTAASRSCRAARPTRSRRPGPSRACSPPGRDPAKVRRSRDPLAYLRSLTSSSGEVRYSRTSRQTPVWVTAQAVMALARKPLPLKPVAARPPRRREPAAPRPRHRHRRAASTAPRTQARAARPARAPAAKAAAAPRRPPRRRRPRARSPRRRLARIPSARASAGLRRRAGRVRCPVRSCTTQPTCRLV